METSPKQIGIIIGIILASFVGLFFAWKATSKPTVLPKLDIKLTETDHIKGKKDAKVLLVEYSDFQCPACKAYQPIVKQVIEKYADKIAFVYRHFPLPLHANAQAAAQAAEAAALQNKFFEMHDVLFDNQKDWESANKPEDQFAAYAKNLKIDVEKFKKDLHSGAVINRVNADKETGLAYAVQATPTFFLNGKKIDAPQSLADFQKVIDEVLALK